MKLNSSSSATESADHRKIRLSYLLTQDTRSTAVRGPIDRLKQITPLPAGQWEIVLTNCTAATADYIQRENPTVPIRQGGDWSGQYVIPLVYGALPSSRGDLIALLTHVRNAPALGAVVAGMNPDLPSLVRYGSTIFRSSAIQRGDGFSSLSGAAANYDLTFRILAGGYRIDYRLDIAFEGIGEEANGGASAIVECEALPDIARRFLPDPLSQIYSQDWERKYRALAAHRSGKPKKMGSMLSRLPAIVRRNDGQAVAGDVIESVFAHRRHAAMIGDWARKSHVWRVVLANYSDNLWATFNACRSSGLQMRCVADNDRAYEDLLYRDLPIVPTNRAFEGGGIDGVILTATQEQKVAAYFKSIRHHFAGPILQLCQSTVFAESAAA